MTGKATATVRPSPRELTDAALKRPVWVRWIDTCGYGSGWRGIDDAHDNFRTTQIDTMGFVVRDDDEAITIAQSIDGDNAMTDHVLTIPRVCLLAVWEIVDR